ncbi:MAG: PH domain-containing protein [Bacteroidota bacterium]
MESAENTLFENPSVDINSLPSTEEVTFNKLAIGYLWVMILRSNAFFIFISVIAGIFTFVNNDFEIDLWLYIVGSWFLFWILINVMIPFKYNKKGYAVRELDIIYKSGLWWRKKIIIPFNRIQHCEVQQGPFSKIFGLRSLTVYTAGGGNSDLRVAGIPEQQAEDLKEFVLSKITAENERNQ